MRVTVLLPSFQRPNDLRRCLAALTQQTRPAEQVIVILRDGDASWKMLSERAQDNLPLKVISVRTPGVVAALNRGLEEMQGDIVVMTDDDAAPHTDWIERIVNHFEGNDQLAGVGGRDDVFHEEPALRGQSGIVGCLQWWGRTVGAHHLGYGLPREVDILKGVNMAFRCQLLDGLRFDERLRGAGAQVDNELAFCLALRRRGAILLYDPDLLVVHYESPRSDEDRVSVFGCSPVAVYNSSYNEALILLEHFYLTPGKRTRILIYLVWSLLLGTRRAPGLVQALRFTPRFRGAAWRRFLMTQQGKFQAAADLQKSWRTGVFPTQPVSVRSE